MKKTMLLFLSFLIVSFSLTSCKDKDADIVVTSYVSYDILNNIVKEKLKVHLIVPFGGEIHDFSPSPKDILMINKSKLFVYSSDVLDVWVNDLVNQNINYLNMSNEVQIEFIDDLGATVHYWTDPFVFINMIDVIANEIIKVDKDNEEFYLENALNYKNEILSIHQDLNNFLNTVDKEVNLFYLGHNALGGFSHRYNITITSLIDHFSPEAELTIKQLESLVNSIKTTNTKYVFIEELVELRVANTIKKELANENIEITILELHGYHNITLKEAKRRTTYADLFRQNVKNIKQSFN